MTPEEQAKQRQAVAREVLQWWFAEHEPATQTDYGPLIDCIADALQAEGDRRAKEAREQALEDAAQVVESYHFSSNTYVANRVRSLIKT